MKVQMMDYFARQTAVREVGIPGLKKLQSAKVTIVGTGGVGSAAAYFLASQGIGHLRLIDQDIVEESNLYRLFGVDQADLHAPKAEALARRLNKRHPWTRTEAIVETLRPENTRELLDQTDLIIDGTDNLLSRYVLNRYALENKTRFLFTSAIANQGHLSMFEPPTTPCLECALPQQEPNPIESCETLGVTSTIVGQVGCLAAMEAAKKILDLPTNILGRMLTIDLLGPDFVFTKIAKRDDCETCGNKPSADKYQGRVVMMCGARTANILPEKDSSINLLSLSGKIPRERLIASSESVVVYNMDGHRVSVFRTGRLLIDGVSNEKAATQIAGEVWSEILG